MRRPDEKSEQRLEAIRRSAAAGNLEEVESYYGLPLLKPPVWTWEVPAYFFVGGAAGAAAVIGLAARLTRSDDRLVRDARWIAAIGATLSAPLLIADLGRPERFLNMLRVFKPRSPMSVGAWLLTVFGGASTAAVLLRGTLADVAAAASAAAGLGMATYTGVLIGATAIPVWSKHVSLLPMHFGASALGSAASLLELRGHDQAALNNLGIAAAAFETLTAGGLLSGPLPLLLRLVGRSKRTRRAAAISTLLGSLITRVAWLEAGKRSANEASRNGDAARSGKTIGKGSPRRKSGHGETDSAGEQ